MSLVKPMDEKQIITMQVENARLSKENDSLTNQLQEAGAELEESRANEAGVLSRWDEALTAAFPAPGVMREPVEGLYRRTEQIRAELAKAKARIEELERQKAELVKVLRECQQFLLRANWGQALAAIDRALGTKQ